MSYAKIELDEDLYKKIKTGNIDTIKVHGYEDGEVFIYEMTAIEKNGRIYKLERNN